MQSYHIVRVSALEMRKRFNESRIVERAASGEIDVKVIEDRHPALTLANEPHCTQSQMLSYRLTDGSEIARAHQYLRPDGSIGASGRPDPKRFLDSGILYRLVKKSKAK